MSNPNDLPLEWFKNLQFAKLSLPRNVAKFRTCRHWLDTPIDMLLSRLKDEVQELTGAIDQAKSPEDIIDECVDIANFVAMLAHKVKVDMEGGSN